MKTTTPPTVMATIVPIMASRTVNTNPERRRSHSVGPTGAGTQWSENPPASTLAGTRRGRAGLGGSVRGASRGERGARSRRARGARGSLCRGGRSRLFGSRSVAGCSGSLTVRAVAAAMEMTTTASVCKNVDTSEPTLPIDEAPQTAAPPARRHQAFAVVATSLGSLVVVAGIIAGLVRIPYDTIGPGSAKVVNKLVTVTGHDSYPPAGQVLYTTVSVRERVSVLQAVLGWLDSTTDVIPEKDVRGDIPPDKYQELNVQAMSDSKTSAEALALARIGYPNLGAGAEVQSVADGSPAATAQLTAKDVIVALDGKAVRTSEDTVNAIRAHKPGDVLRVRVDRGGMPTDLVATLTEAKDGSALLGVRLATKIQLPFEIKIDSGQVVGPSAGLAYALELLDVLTPGELTGGAGVKVAATGELGANGAVGAIGGIAQKVTTVKRAGATAFIVPKENEAEARKHAGKNLKIYGVASFDEALAVLGSMQGSNALALAKPAAAPAPA